MDDLFVKLKDFVDDNLLLFPEKRFIAEKRFIDWDLEWLGWRKEYDTHTEVYILKDVLEQFLVFNGLLYGRKKELYNSWVKKGYIKKLKENTMEVQYADIPDQEFNGDWKQLMPASPKKSRSGQLQLF